MYLIDTNIIYYFSGYEEPSNKINTELLKERFLHSPYKISPYTIFELLNQPRFEENFLTYMKNLFKANNNYFILTNEIFSQYVQDDEICNVLTTDQKKLRDKLSKPIINEYKANIVNRFVAIYISYVYVIGIILSEKHINLKNYFTNLYKNFQFHLNSYVYNSLYTLYKNKVLNEKNIKIVYNSYLYYITNTLNIALNNFIHVWMQGYTCISQLKKDFLKLNEIIPHQQINLPDDWVFYNTYAVTPYVVDTLKSKFLDIDEEDIQATLIYDIVRHFDGLKQLSKLDYFLLSYDMNNLFFKQTSIKSNNYIDYSILKLYSIDKPYVRDEYYFLTLDRPLQNVMKNSNNDALKTSYNEIQKFYK